MTKNTLFIDAIWSVRLQMLWIVFAAVYTLGGHLYPKILLSSILIVFAGLLLLSILAHTLVMDDRTRARGLLLVALTASFFIIDVSIRLFRDYLACMFAFLFAYMMAELLWTSYEHMSIKRKRREYTYFVVVSGILTAAIVEFPINLLLKYVLSHSGTLDGHYVFGQMGTGTLVALTYGLVLGGRLLPDSIPYKDLVCSRTALYILISVSLLTAIFAVPMYFVNDRRVLSIAGDNTIYAFSVTYAYLLVLSLSYTLFLGHFGRQGRDVGTWKYGEVSLWILLGVIVGSCNALIIAGCRVVFGQVNHVKIHFHFAIEITTSLGIVLALVLCFRSIRSVVESLLRQKESILRSNRIGTE